MKSDTSLRTAIGLIRRVAARGAQLALWRGEPPRDGWHSFDRTPWRHPWLTSGNLGAMRDYSTGMYAWAAAQAQGKEAAPLRFAFVGNMGNAMHNRAVPLRRRGLQIDVVLHPQDRYVMSHPEWEEYAGDLPEGVHSIDEARARGIDLPRVGGVFEFPLDPAWPTIPLAERPRFMNWLDYERFPSFMPLMPTLTALHTYDCCLATQVQYLAWLARRPYLVAQTGGDIWYEASRADTLGWIQRAAFRDAAAFLASNPWSFAHARRLGLRNLVYVPVILDDHTYAPGEGCWRERWRAVVGGSFFVLSTARLDRFFKGSDVALDGFAEFARYRPEARLVVLGWGEDRDRALAALRERGLNERLHVMPVAGKRRLVEYLRSADCLLDQFALGYYGATAMEALACGLPVLMRMERAQYDSLVPAGAPPVLHAATPDQVRAQLERLAGSTEHRRGIGEASRRWFLEAHGAERWGPVYANLLTATARRRRFGFARSPLCAPLAPDEQAYHAAELAAAPPFPRYY